VFSDRRIVASALFARELLVGRVDSVDLALLLRFECNAGLLTFFHRTNYDRFEPVNNAIINFNKYCHWFGFCGEVGCDMVLHRLESALSGERFDHPAFAIIYYDVKAKTLSSELFVLMVPVLGFGFFQFQVSP
jgi:hypothetical protein